MEYRRRNGQQLAPEMAVAVQQMLVGGVSGVIFSQHPVTGNPGAFLTVIEIEICGNCGAENRGISYENGTALMYIGR